MRNLLGKLFGISKSSILHRILQLNTTHNIACSASYLPLVSASLQELDETYEVYYKLIDDLTQLNTRHTKTNDITVKLYQFGQYLLPQDTFLEKFSQLCTYAKQHGIFVRIDTSDRTYYAARHIIEETVGVYMHLLEHGFTTQDLGLCISSNITSYTKIVEKIFDTHAPSIRLVKGFYNNYDITSRSEVTQHYIHVAQRLRSKDTHKLAFATHDHTIIEHLIATYSNVPKRSHVELQSFIDVHDTYIYELAKKYAIRVYIPFWKTASFLWRWRRWFDKIRARERVLWLPTYTNTFWPPPASSTDR